MLESRLRPNWMEQEKRKAIDKEQAKKGRAELIFLRFGDFFDSLGQHSRKVMANCYT